jgi:predicted transcriptional regulator
VGKVPNEEINELKQIKKLLVLIATKSNSTQQEIGNLLGMTQANVAQILKPQKKRKKKGGKNER